MCLTAPRKCLSTILRSWGRDAKLTCIFLPDYSSNRKHPVLYLRTIAALWDGVAETRCAEGDPSTISSLQEGRADDLLQRARCRTHTWNVMSTATDPTVVPGKVLPRTKGSGRATS
jgi:hypothetical protein